MAQDTSISHHIDALLLQAQARQKVTVAKVVEQLGESSIALALVAFTLISSLPLFSIPGFTTITGIPIIILGAQLVFSKSGVWMPKRVGKHELKSEKLWRFLERSLPYLRKAERLLKPRILMLSEAPMRHFIGVIFVVMGVLLALPIPFINFPAGFSMFLLALGLVERDGILISFALFCIGLILFGMVYAGLAIGDGWQAIAVP